jgi:hypothetical protein
MTPFPQIAGVISTVTSSSEAHPRCGVSHLAIDRCYLRRSGKVNQSTAFGS